MKGCFFKMDIGERLRLIYEGMLYKRGIYFYLLLDISYEVKDNYVLNSRFKEVK